MDLEDLAHLGKSEWKQYIPGPGTYLVSAIGGLVELPNDLPMLDLYLDKKYDPLLFNANDL